MSGFGNDDPRKMPAHFFYRSLRVDYETAVQADTDKQNCSICPRYWYVDTTFRCDRCGAEFSFSAAEQRAWYEDYGFWVDSRPRHCLACRQDLRTLKGGELPPRINENRRLLANQIARAEEGAA